MTKQSNQLSKFNIWLKKKRVSLGIDRSTMGNLVGLTRAQIRNLEIGHSQWPFNRAYANFKLFFPDVPDLPVDPKLHLALRKIKWILRKPKKKG